MEGCGGREEGVGERGREECGGRREECGGGISMDGRGGVR